MSLWTLRTNSAIFSDVRWTDYNCLKVKWAMCDSVYIISNVDDRHAKACIFSFRTQACWWANCNFSSVSWRHVSLWCVIDWPVDDMTVWCVTDWPIDDMTITGMLLTGQLTTWQYLVCYRLTSWQHDNIWCVTDWPIDDVTTSSVLLTG